MSVSLRDAAATLDQRKTSLFGDDIGALVDVDGARRLALGFDLDIDEVYGVAEAAAVAMLHGIGSRITPPVPAMIGNWYDGLLTGLMLAELRARETVTS